MSVTFNKVKKIHLKINSEINFNIEENYPK